MIFAAIDIGSNAVRLLFCHVHEQRGKTIYKKGELIRLPIRLGEDSFLKNEISKEKEDKLVVAMRGFRDLISVFDVISYRACATSAMRDASNGKDVIDRIKRESGIEVEILDGKEEADVIFSNHVEELLDPKQSYMYIDVGGGSTELTILTAGKVVASKSFDVGTLRMLFEKVSKDEWEEYKSWIKKNASPVKPLIAIGSGGNINKLFKMGAKKDSKSLSYEKLKELHDMLSSHTYEERILSFGLNPDRADVIVPAAKIFISAMKHGGIEKIIVPQVGLSDGIVHGLYERYKNSNKSIV